MQNRNLSAVDLFLTGNVRTFIRDFPANMYLMDRNFLIVGCSSYFAKNFGYESPEEIIGMSVHQFWPPQFASDIISDSEHVFQTGEILEVMRPYVDSAGDEKLYLFRKTPLKDVHGNLFGLFAFVLDITAQRKLEELEKTQRAGKKHFSDILSLAPGRIYWKNLKGEYLGCNKATARDAGYDSPAEMVGLTDVQMPWKEDAEVFREQDRLVVTNDQVYQFEEEGVLQDKGVVWLTRKEPLKDEDGNIFGTIGISIDVSAQKKNEYLEREKIELEKQQLERKLEIQEEFRGLVMQANHDMGSPLLVLDLFARKYLEFAPEEQRNSVRNSINRIRAIASSMLLHFPPKEANFEQPSESRVLLVPLLSEVISEKRQEYSNLAIDLRENFDPDAYLVCSNINPHALKRMMSNAINNSVDALVGIRFPIISIGVHRVQGNDCGDKITITVLDNGPGMPEIVREKILNRIPITAGKKNGHGIGYLQISETLKLHHGTLDIDLPESGGTLVTFRFPALLLPDYFVSSIEVHSCDTIVVVDDDPSIHEALDLRFIESWSVNRCKESREIKHFTQGEEAFQYVNSLSELQKQHVYLLTDYEFINQNMNGIELINRLKLKRAILVTSYYSDQDVIAEAKMSGIQILPKILADKVSIVFNCKNCLERLSC